MRHLMNLLIHFKSLCLNIIIFFSLLVRVLLWRSLPNEETPGSLAVTQMRSSPPAFIITRMLQWWQLHQNFEQQFPH